MSTIDPNDEMLRATRESQGRPMDTPSSSPEGRQEAAVASLTPMSGFLVFLKDMRFTGSWDVPTLDRAIEVGETIVSQSLDATALPAPVAAAPVGVISASMMFECAACTEADLEANCYPANRTFLVDGKCLCEDCYAESHSAAGAPRISDILPAALIAPAKPAVELVEARRAGQRAIDEIIDRFISKDKNVEPDELADYLRRIPEAMLAALQAPATPDAQTEVEK